MVRSRNPPRRKAREEMAYLFNLIEFKDEVKAREGIDRNKL